MNLLDGDAGSAMTNEEFVAGLAAENRAFYSTDDGRGALLALGFASEERWTYLFELLQNAIDAKARRVRIRTSARSLSFEHDGTELMSAANVRGLSKVFRSTKGAGTVGFMGVGFKSVFRRYRRVAVSDVGWRFRYEIDVAEGQYQERVPDYLGAVIPIWDTGIAPPTDGYTTCFELSEP